MIKYVIGPSDLDDYVVFHRCLKDYLEIKLWDEIKSKYPEFKLGDTLEFEIVMKER